MDYKTINDYPNYTIYEDGTVLNHITFKIMGETKSTGNRLLVTLTNSPKDKKLFDIGLLVARHFIPIEDPETNNIIMRKDKNNSNNHVSNLIWTRKGEDLRRYTKDELKENKKKTDKRQREKYGKEQYAEWGRKWRQTPEGHFIRNRNHWIATKVREPEEGWRDFYFNKFLPSTHCELCHVEFSPIHNNMKQRCLEHDHKSKYIRSICCRKCNQGQVRKTDFDMCFVLLELHRKFNLYKLK